MESLRIARYLSISASATAAAVVVLLARRIWTIPAWKIAKTAKIPISITVIDARSSIMPKPCSLRARVSRMVLSRNTANVIGTAAFPLKARRRDADSTAGYGVLRIHGDQRFGSRARRGGERA